MRRENRKKEEREREKGKGAAEFEQQDVARSKILSNIRHIRVKQEACSRFLAPFFSFLSLSLSTSFDRCL